MTDETVVDVLEVAEKVLVEVSDRVKVRTGSRRCAATKCRFDAGHTWTVVRVAPFE